MVLIYISISTAAVMITLAYLSEYKEKNLYKGNSLDEDSPRMLVEKCRKQFTRPYQLLLIPILAQGGLISSLAFSDWNKVTIVTEISHAEYNLLLSSMYVQSI